MQHRLRVMSLGLVAAALGIWGAQQWPGWVAGLSYAVEVGKADAAAEKLARAEDLSAAYRHVAQAVKPSLVFITATKEARPVRRAPVGDREEMLRRFFGGEFPQFGPPDATPQSGLGSGVIVSKDGHVLTNSHVVNGFDKLEVHIVGGGKATAKVVGVDPKTDVAVIKIDRDGLRPAKLGDSDKMEVGDIVMAAGTPFGLDQTITQGIISAKGRNNVGITDYEDFLQTDAAINPGNSGGPLLNLKGEVIGINTAIFSRSGGYQGIGFAIPINLARDIMDRLIKDGKVNRGWLGVSIQNLTPELKQSFGFAGDAGVLVGDADSGGPAAKSGIRSGDILLSVDGKPVEDVNALRNLVAGMEPGRKVSVKLFREGREQTLDVTLGELPGSATAMGRRLNRPDARNQAPAVEDKLGLSARNLDPRTARALGLRPDSGVVITDVLEGGAAAEAGLRTGDVVLSVAGTAVRSVDDFENAVAAQDLAKGFRMAVRSNGLTRFVFVRAAE
jgi:serine protease Do